MNKKSLRWIGIIVIIAVGIPLLFHIPLVAEFRDQMFSEAADQAEFTKARILLFLGADINYQTGSGSVMHSAAASGRIDIMEFMYKHGAKVDAPVKFGVTPLYMAREAHQTDAEGWLLGHGANPDTSHISPP